MLSYKDIIELGLKKGLEEVEIYAETKVSNTIKVFDGELANYNSNEIFGMSLRGLYKGKMCQVYTETLDEESINNIIDQLIINASCLTTTEEEHVYEGGKAYQNVENPQADFSSYSLNEKVNMLKEMSKEALAKGELIKKIGHLQYGESSGKICIINSRGLNLSRDYSYMLTYLSVVAINNDKTSVGFSIDVGKKFKQLETKRVVDEATSNALSSLGATTVESGEYEVVLSNEVATDILSAFSSIFSGESALRKLTILTDKLGTKVFGDNITIVDDPFCDLSIMKYPFDDEGVPCTYKEIVKNGIFNGFLHSLKTAKAFNTTPTGNGFKSSTSSPIAPNPTCLYIVGEDFSEDDLIKSCNNGIYVTEVNGLHAGLNPISGAFNVQASGFLIENGKKTKPITLFVISGNFYEMMNNVAQIARMDKKITGDAASPALRIKKLIISGK